MFLLHEKNIKFPAYQNFRKLVILRNTNRIQTFLKHLWCCMQKTCQRSSDCSTHCARHHSYAFIQWNQDSFRLPIAYWNKIYSSEREYQPCIEESSLGGFSLRELLAQGHECRHASQDLAWLQACKSRLGLSSGMQVKTWLECRHVSQDLAEYRNLRQGRWVLTHISRHVSQDLSKNMRG